VRVGGLVAMQPASTRRWEVSVVRRLSRDDKGNPFAGLYVYSKGAIPVRVSPATEGAAAAAQGEQKAALLSSQRDNQQLVRLLLRVGTFRLTQPLKMRVLGKEYHLTPVELEAGSDDYDIAAFKVWEQT